MASKIFSSPGVCSRPLNVFERLQEWHRWFDLKASWAGLSWRLRHPLWRWRSRHLLRALEAGSYDVTPLTAGQPLQVEDLQATMQVVTFDERSTRI